MTLLQIFYSNVGRNGPWHLNKSHNLKILSLIYPDQQSNLRVDRCLHYGGAMSGPISHPASTGGWVWTTLDVVYYISDKVFFLKKDRKKTNRVILQFIIRRKGIE